MKAKRMLYIFSTDSSLKSHILAWMQVFTKNWKFLISSQLREDFDALYWLIVANNGKFRVKTFW